MSRIAKNPIPVPKGVEVNITPVEISVKGPLGTIARPMDPNVGLENHTVGEACRFGIWIDGAFSWISDSAWERHIDYEHETLVGDRHGIVRLLEK